MPNPMRNPMRFLLIIFVLALLAAACGDDDASETTMADGSLMTAAATTTAAAATTTAPHFSGATPGDGDNTGAPSEGGTDAQEVVAVLQPGDFGRSIVYTAGLEIEVDDVISAGRQALVELSGLGGVLFGQETSSGPEPRSVLTIKVLPANFAAALERLAGLGTLVSQTVYADDVTERVVDLQSRITTAEASVERLRAFLEGATDLEGVTAMEAQLLQRETDLELMRGELRTLEDQVALATIVLVLTQPTPGPAFEMVQTGYLGHNTGAGCPGSEELALDEGQDFTLCYEVVNTGDTYLGGLEVRDEGFSFDPDELLVLDGDPAALWPPEGACWWPTRPKPTRMSTRCPRCGRRRWTPTGHRCTCRSRRRRWRAWRSTWLGTTRCPASATPCPVPGTPCSGWAGWPWSSARPCCPSCGSRR